MITLDFQTPISADRRDVFAAAAARWDGVIDTAFAPVTLDGRRIDGVVIGVSVSDIDGPQGVLGQAGPTVLRFGSELPAAGIMEFDNADLARLEAEGSFADVILHEMGHVLGFGTLWDRQGLIAASGTDNPLFSGASAAREFGTLLGSEVPQPVPVANTGGPGTREGHWRELVFGDELLTGFLSGADRPLSRLSVASFADLGYEVNLDAADAFSLPDFRSLASKGIMAAVQTGHLCRMGRPEPRVMDAP